MVDTWIPDCMTTLEELPHCYILLEEDWEHFAQDRDMRLQMALMAMILISSFSGALWGEEIPKIELGVIRKHWQEAVHHPTTPHVPLVLSGWFKLTDGERLFFLPLACRSQAGINIRLWTHQLQQTYKELGVVSGPVFRVAQKGGKVKRSAMGDLDLLFHGILGCIQEHWPRVLPVSVKVQDETSVWWSLCRGSMTEASNRGIPREVVEANQHWGKHQRSRGVLPNMNMMERYSDARANVGYLIRYSLGL
jgi:hypothetical protein